jgi:hypothetical protein
MLPPMLAFLIPSPLTAFVEEQIMKLSHYTPRRRMWGEEVQLLLILDLGPPVPIVQEAGWAPEPVWTQRLEEKFFAPTGYRTSIIRSSSP